MYKKNERHEEEGESEKNSTRLLTLQFSFIYVGLNICENGQREYKNKKVHSFEENENEKFRRFHLQDFLKES